MNQVKMKTLSLVCPSCGGNMELSTDGKKAACPYCGHEMLIEKDESAKRLYEQRIAKARAEEEIRDLQRNQAPSQGLVYRSLRNRRNMPDLCTHSRFSDARARLSPHNRSFHCCEP